MLDIRTNLTRKNKETPNNLNWPSVYLYTDSDFMGLHGQTKYPQKYGFTGVLRRWTHFCCSFDFLANEVQMAINGEVYEKRRDPKTYPKYKDQFYPNYKQQFGGAQILQETKDSKYILTLGRYHFDDHYAVIKYAGINAWHKTLSEEKLASLSSCEQIPDGFDNEDLITNEAKWTYPSTPLIKETEFDSETFLCTKRKKYTVVPIPIRKDTRAAMEDVCQKFGSDVKLAGDLRSLEDMQHYLQIIHSNKRFQATCGFDDGGRFSTWIPYTINSDLDLVHDVTGEIFDIGEDYHSPGWDNNAANFKKKTIKKW